MTIRKKLLLFAILTITGIAVIGGVSLVGMRIIQGKLHLLTERSTPYQLKTIELQRTMQEHTSNLLKVALATNDAEFAAAQEATKKSEAEVAQRADDLKTLMDGASANTIKVEGMATLAREIISTTEGRIKAEQAAKAADSAMKSQLSDIDKRLDQLNSSMSSLQKGSSKRLSSASDKARDITQKLMSLTQMRDSLKDMNFAFVEIQKVEGRKPLLLLRSKMDTALGVFAANRLSSSTEPGVKTIVDHVAEIKKQSASLIEQRGLIIGKTATDEQKQLYEQLAQSIGTQLSSALTEIDQEITIATDRYSIENRSHDDSLRGSTAASDTVVLTGALLSACFEINSRGRELFSARTKTDLEKTANEIRRQLGTAEGFIAKLRKTLTASNSTLELKLLGGVSASLAETKKLLFGDGGVLGRLGQVIEITQKALDLNSRLKDFLAEQRTEGEKGVTAAQKEQAKAVGSVNRIVTTNITTILIVGLAILALAIVFSTLLSRSITTPIKELTSMAEKFGNGDFNSRLDDRRSDEFGLLAGHFNNAVDRLREITSGLRNAITHLAENSRGLLQTADELNRGAQQQASQVMQVATAMTEMNQTIHDVAQNAGNASDATNNALVLASGGKDTVGKTVKGMEDIAKAVRETATTIGQLGSSSEKIGEIVNTINEIADQTNLLALNAAIEAARAGDAGRGFAVVADEVRRLAERTSEATGEISDMVREIQTQTNKSVYSMESGTLRVEEGVVLAGEASQALESIVEASSLGADMVTRIATASEQQSATASEVSTSMEQIEAITRSAEAATGEVSRAARELAGLADELNTMAAWFKE